VAATIVWMVSATLLVTTVVCQRPMAAWVRTVKYHDIVAFVPSWTFFAPNPGTTDTRVLWRECTVDGAVSPWHDLLPPTGGLLRAVWNPLKRQHKLLTDTGPMVVRAALRNPTSDAVLVGLPYLLLLNRVMSLPSSTLAVSRQFLVVQTRHDGVEDEDIQPLFASRWHRLEHASTPDGETSADRQVGS
jgi:hypothetical protein